MAPALAFDRALVGGGQSLPEPLRSDMEGRFGHSFADIRIHAGGAEAGAAAEAGATAVTVGNDILIGSDAPPPSSPAGVHLLAHELAHSLQQRSGDAAPSGGHEQQAHQAADQVLSGQRVSGTGWRSAAASPQLAEKGTYVSTVGDKKYLDAGAGFYTNWGYPNVQRVGSIEDVVTDLAKGKDHIDKFRIVSHGYAGELHIGSLGDLGTDRLNKDDAEKVSSPAGFRGMVSGLEIVDQPTYTTEVGLLQKDATTAPLMKAIGADTGTPDRSSPLGMLLRAIIEEHFLAALTLPGGGAMGPIQDRAVLDQYNALRIDTYTETVASALPAAADQKAARAAVKSLRKSIGAVMTAAKRTYTMSQADADGMAAGFMDDPAKKRLSPKIKRSVVEGGGKGPYLTNLDKARAKIDDTTHIEIRGCKVGETPEFLEKLRALFGKPGGKLPSISAPDLWQYFFRLSYDTYTKNPKDEAKLAKQWTDEGIGKTYEIAKRVRKKEMYPVLNEKTLAEFATKYGFELKKLELLNPELKNKPDLSEGMRVWLVARPPVPVGTNTTIKDFCAGVLGDAALEPDIRSYNPKVKEPTAKEKEKDPTLTELKPGDSLWVVPEKLVRGTAAEKAKDPTLKDENLRTTTASAAPILDDLKAELRAGTGFMGFDTAGSVPRIRLDDSKAASALSAWLAAQGYDAKKRSAAKLEAPYAKGFAKAAAGTYVEFLSEQFPEFTIVDTVFPDDPRYPSHIIKRP